MCQRVHADAASLVQAVMEASKKRFTLEARSDPVALATWLLNELHVGLTGGKRKAPSVITRCFQGQLQVGLFPAYSRLIPRAC